MVGSGAAAHAPAVKPSQHGTVTQQVAATTITVDYNRPVARGRELFGALVPYDKVWCPGADDCTTLEVSTDITIEGKELAGGHLLGLGEARARRSGRSSSIARSPIFHTRYQSVADQDVADARGHAARRRAHGNARLLLPRRQREARRAGAALGHRGGAPGDRRAVSRGCRLLLTRPTA